MLEELVDCCSTVPSLRTAAWSDASREVVKEDSFSLSKKLLASNQKSQNEF